MLKNLYKSEVVTSYSLIQYTDDKFRFIVKNQKLLQPVKNYSPRYDSSYSNMMRTKRKVREIAICNNFEYFVTLTVSPSFCNREDLDVIISHLRRFLKKYRRKNKDFIFLLIAEKHSDNKSFHFHGLMAGINSNDIYKNVHGYYSCSFFDDIGFNSFSVIRDKDRVCNYITKYITKDIQKTSTGHSYFCSRGLNRPTVTHYLQFPVDEVLDKTYENDYCKFFDFDIKNLDSKALYKLLYTLDKYKID